MNGTTLFISWLSLGIGILALILAWSAFNRTGTDVRTAAEQETRETLNTYDERLNALEEGLRNSGADALDEGADALDSGAQELRTDE